MKFAVQRTGAVAGVTEDFFCLTLLGALAAIAWGVLAGLALLLTQNFLTIACDTAVLQSAIANTIHGHWFANNGPGGPNILGSHTTFLLLLVIPVYIVAPYPETLFLLQTAGVCSVVFPLFLVARDLGLKPLMAFAIAASSLVSALVIHTALAPFHLETWIPPAALWAYHFYLRNNLPAFLASLLIAVCCGEQAALIFVALGISLLVVRDEGPRRRLFGTISLVLGLLWIFLAVVVISPLAAPHAAFNIFAYNYTPWNVHSASGLPGALASHPLRMLVLFFDPYRWGHIASLVGLLLVSAFFSWRSALLLLPAPAYLLMGDQEFYLYFHAYYYSFVFVAGYIGLLHFLRRSDPSSRLTVTVLALFWIVSAITLCTATGYYFQLTGGVDEPFSSQLRKQFAKIPPDATVYGPHRYSVYLSNRDNFVIGDLKDEPFDFDTMLNAQYDKTHIRPDQVDYIVSDFYTDQCGWRQGFLSVEQHQARANAIKSLVDSGQWERVWQENDVAILKRMR